MANKGLKDLFDNKNQNENTVMIFTLPDATDGAGTAVPILNGKHICLYKSDFELVSIKIAEYCYCFLRYKLDKKSDLMYCYSLLIDEYKESNFEQLTKNIDDYLDLWINKYSRNYELN